MRYWWVNQNKTYRHEVPGGYMWSPKRKSNDHRNPYYDFMRVVSPGDLVFSFFGKRISAIGVVRSYAYEAPKPLEFGAAGTNWSNIGWRVDVHFHELRHQIHPAEHIEALRPYMPTKYSPLIRKTGSGAELYLTLVPSPLAEILVGLIGQEASEPRQRGRLQLGAEELPGVSSGAGVSGYVCGYWVTCQSGG